MEFAALQHPRPLTPCPPPIATSTPSICRPNGRRRAGAARPALQLPTYPDAAALEGVAGRNARAAAAGDVVGNPRAARSRSPKRRKASASCCRAAIAPRVFDDCTPDVISNRLKVLLQMSLVLVHGLRLPVVRVGRFAGQYAKPRSADTETRDGVTLPELPRRHRQRARIHRRGAHARSAPHGQGACAFGDDDELHPRADRRRLRRPAPSRVLGPRVGGALAACRRVPAAWSTAIGDAVRFMETLSGSEVHNLNRVDFYTSHEALLLPYEEAQTRAGAAAVGLVQPQHALPVDRHAHRRSSTARTSSTSAASAIRSA